MLKHIRHCTILLVFLTPILAAAQDFAAIDEKAREVPFPKNQDIQQLAVQLTEGLSTEKEKARAIYVWLTEHISYDVRTAFDEDAETEDVLAKQRSRVVLKSKKAVCEGYANLFCDLCDAVGIKAIRVTGATKNMHGRIPRIGHAWNLVRADGQWGLMDPTWGAGTVDDEAQKFIREFHEEFFFAAPAFMAKNHFPYDPLYQLSAQPINFQQFTLNDEQRAALPLTDPDPHFIHFTDSLDALVALDSNAQFLNSVLRTLRFDPSSNRARYYLAQHLCNRSVSVYNEYVEAQNQMVINKVRPTKDIVQGFNQKVGESENYARQSLAEAERVAPGDRYWGGIGGVKRRAKEMQRACLDAKKRNDELLKRL